MTEVQTKEAQTKEDQSSLAKAAYSLQKNERDYGAWWEIAEAFGRLKELESASEAYVSLGEAANELAMVSLSLACVLRLEELGKKEKSDRLLSSVSKNHGKGSKRVETKKDMPPKAPCESLDKNIALASDFKEAKRIAFEAIDVASKAAKARYPKRLQATPLINFLDSKALGRLISVMSLKRYVRGDIVVDVGDEAESLFWVVRGSAEVSRDERLLGELQSDSFFGEIALVGSTQRTARVACLEKTTLLVIPANELGELAIQAPHLAMALATHARTRMLRNVGRTSELFKRLSSEERRALLPKFESCFAKDGERLVEAGKENNNFYVLVSGQCEVRNGADVLGLLSAGEGFGEMSMLGRKDATYDVVAKGPVVLLRVARTMFDEIAIEHPELLSEVYKLLVQRERENKESEVFEADDLVI